MLRLQERTLESGWGHHQRDPVRVYAEDPVQKDRIKRAQKYLRDIIADGVGHHSKILELGCGTGDISGPFCYSNRVVGIDVASQQIQKARERFPNGEWLMGPVEYYASGPWDVIVMCEFLEHIEEPKKLVERWLPNASHAIISHPINEPVNSQLSAGDHCWSYTEEDFKKWFEIGGHEIQDQQIFQMGAYDIALGWSKKKTKGGKQ